MHLNKTDIYVLSWLWNATSSFPAFLGQSGCMWHCWEVRGPKGTGSPARERFGGWRSTERGEIPSVSPAFAIFPVLCGRMLLSGCVLL